MAEGTCDERRGGVRVTSGIPNEKEWLNTKEVAEYIEVERITIQRWCGSGYLRGV